MIGFNGNPKKAVELCGSEFFVRRSRPYLQEQMGAAKVILFAMNK
jgi:hypothetical protein